MIFPNFNFGQVPSKLRKKLDALRRVTVERGATPAEAETASALAQKIEEKIGQAEPQSTVQVVSMIGKSTTTYFDRDAGQWVVAETQTFVGRDQNGNIVRHTRKWVHPL